MFRYSRLFQWFRLRRYRKLHKARCALLEKGLREGEHFITIADVPHLTYKGVIRASEILQEKEDPHV